MKVGGIVVRRIGAGSSRASAEMVAGDVCQITALEASGVTGTMFAAVRLLRTGRVQPGTWMLSLFDPLEAVDGHS